MRAPFLPHVIAFAAGLAVAWPLSRRAITAREASGAERAAVSPDATLATDATPPLPPALTLKALLALPRREFWQPFAVWLAQADAGQLAAFAEAAPGQWWEREWAVWRGLFARWTALDLRAARAFYEDHLPGTEPDTFDFAFLAGWVENDRDAALSAAWQRQLALDATATSQREIDWTRSFEAVATVAAEADPVGFLEWRRALPDAGTRAATRSAADAALGHLMAADPAQAEAEMKRRFDDGEAPAFAFGSALDEPAARARCFASIDRLPPGPRKEAMIDTLAKADKTGQGAAAVAQWLGRLPASSAKLAQLHEVTVSWMKADPQAALSWARGLPGQERIAALRAVAVGASVSDPALMLRIVDELGPQRMLGGFAWRNPDWLRPADAVHRGLTALGKTDPAVALSGFAECGLPADSMGPSVSDWFARDPAAAAHWAEQAATGENGSAAALPAFWGEFVRQPLLASRVFDALTDGARGQLLDAVKERRVIVGDFGASMSQMIEQLERPLTEEQREMLFSMITRSSPEAAAKWIDRFPGGEERAVAVNRLDSVVASYPDDSLVEFVTSLPRDVLEAVDMMTLGARCAQVDLSTATELLDALPAGARRDVAIEGFVKNSAIGTFIVSNATAEAALRWALAMENPEKRRATVVDVLNRWTAESGEPAMEALARSGLSAEAQAELLRLSAAAKEGSR